MQHAHFNAFISRNIGKIINMYIVCKLLMKPRTSNYELAGLTKNYCHVWQFTNHFPKTNSMWRGHLDIRKQLSSISIYNLNHSPTNDIGQLDEQLSFKYSFWLPRSYPLSLPSLRSVWLYPCPVHRWNLRMDLTRSSPHCIVCSWTSWLFNILTHGRLFA